MGMADFVSFWGVWEAGCLDYEHRHWEFWEGYYFPGVLDFFFFGSIVSQQSWKAFVRFNEELGFLFFFKT